MTGRPSRLPWPRAPRGTTAALLVGSTLLVTACGGTDRSRDPAGSEVPTSQAPSSDPRPSARAGSGQGAMPRPEQGEEMQIEITAGSDRFTATLEESAAGRDLLAQLPVTIEMRDHGGVEKTGPLPAPLSLAGQPEGADPDVGDLGYYAPGNDLVLYHGDQSSFPGIVVLGRLDGDAAERIAAIEGDLTVTVSALDA